FNRLGWDLGTNFGYRRPPSRSFRTSLYNGNERENHAADLGGIAEEKGVQVPDHSVAGPLQKNDQRRVYLLQLRPFERGLRSWLPTVFRANRAGRSHQSNRATPRTDCRC